MAKTLSQRIDLETLEKDVDIIKKKIFIYETMQSKKEIKEGKAIGPFKTGKEFLEEIKQCRDSDKLRDSPRIFPVLHSD